MPKPTPTTAAEAFTLWRSQDQYVRNPDNDPIREDVDDTLEAAVRALQLAEKENLSLEALVPDKEELERLRGDAKFYQEAEEQEADGWPENDDYDAEDFKAATRGWDWP